MILEGHDELLMDALKRVPEFLDVCSEFFRLPKDECLHLLRHGGHIPDLPHSEFDVEQKLMFLKGFKFKQTFREKLLHFRRVYWEASEVVHSHRGLGSLGHSMYSGMYAVRRPVQMGQKIVRRCAGWMDYMNSIGTNNLRLSLLGIILHSVVDSYSAAHTIRLTPEQRQHISDFTCETKPIPMEQVSKALVVSRAIKDSLQSGKSPSIESLWNHADIRYLFGTRSEWDSFREVYASEIAGMINMIRFEFALDKAGKKYLPKRSGKFKTTLQYPYLVDFQSATAIHPLRHYRYDWVRTAKKLGLYSFACRDIETLLRIFLKSLSAPKKAIREMVAYLSEFTFNTEHAIPVDHEVHLDLFSTKICTVFSSK